MLELVSSNDNLYFRVVHVEISLVNNAKKNDRYKIKRLLSRRVFTRNTSARRRQVIQYLIKWKDWDLAHNV